MRSRGRNFTKYRSHFLKKNRPLGKTDINGIGKPITVAMITENCYMQRLQRKKTTRNNTNKDQRIQKYLLYSKFAFLRTLITAQRYNMINSFKIVTAICNSYNFEWIYHIISSAWLKTCNGSPRQFWTLIHQHNHNYYPNLIFGCI